VIYSCCDENGQTRKNAVLTNPTGITATPVVEAAGSGYALGDVLTIVQTNSGENATVDVTAVSASGGVTEVSLSQSGTNYSTAIGVATSGGKGSGCTLNISATPNGIDYLEVLDHDAIALNSPRQRTLLVHCLRPVPTNLTSNNILITGGESITGITADWVAPASAPPVNLTNTLEQQYFEALSDSTNVLIVRTHVAGDFSPYTLRLVNNASQASEDPIELTEVLTGFDPQLAEIEFSFKVECGQNFDCSPAAANCTLPQVTPPSINYLAKDYGSFRQIILDRLSQLLPGWTGTNEADFGVALAELIAFVGDRLSYWQDAIATEAYLETARSRVSLRRHALLVDYHVHDGCDARVWVQVQVEGDSGTAITVPAGAIGFCTAVPGVTLNAGSTAADLQAALLKGVQFFEPMQAASLYPEHNQMYFYTWQETNCCLPQAATEATLQGTYENLHPGDVLIFQEVKGPQTGDPADADIRHRCAVRLTQVATQDASGNLLVDALFDELGNAIQSPAQTPMPVTEIQWSEDDALPFPVCISSSYLDDSGDENSVTDVSVALGNIVLADHGLSLTNVSLGTVPPPQIYIPPDPAADRCQSTSPSPIPTPFRPQLPDTGSGDLLTQQVPLPEAGIPVTPSVVNLSPTRFVNLTDAKGSVCFMVQATNPASWPQYLGLVVKQNQKNAANFDLSVVYNPPRGAAGTPVQVVLENFVNLSLNKSNANYAPVQINSFSQLIQVPSSYSPPTTPPAGFPTTPTILPNSGSVNLQDDSSPPVTYLVVEAASQVNWPAFFGVLAQPVTTPNAFNLVIVYDPLSGGVGVRAPVTVEQFSDVTLASVATQFSSKLVHNVASFDQLPNPSLSAYDLMNYDPSDAVPAITLAGTLNGMTTSWTAEQDLLESGELDQVFVVEVESDGTTILRFGDNTNGLAPAPQTSFSGNYRVGNGTAGNIGAESLQLNPARTQIPGIQGCSNPLPAVGGTDPETNDQIRRRAPQAFLTQERAITMADYQNMTKANPNVDSAVATLRWTGSWYTVFVAAEPKGGGDLTSTLQTSLTQSLAQYRLAGQDLALQSPQYVSLEIELQVCVDPNYFQSKVQQSLLQVLGNQILPNGQKGVFYPDNFTFGQTVYLSPVYAAGRGVAGVVSVVATKFQPQGINTAQYLQTGEIKLGSLQIARLENDPNYPDHGQLSLIMSGGK